MLKLTKIIIALLLLVSASFAQSPLLTLMADETVADPYGEELVTGGDFSNAGDWLIATTSGTAEVTGGQCDLTNFIGSVYQVIVAIEEGTTYHVTITPNITNQLIRIGVGGVYSDWIIFGVDEMGVPHSFDIVAGASQTVLIQVPNATNGSFDDVSVKEVL